MFQKGQRLIIAVAMVAAVAVGSAVIANAASSGGTTQNGSGQDESPLTGEAADKVTAAAKDKVPGGTVLRVETDSGSAAYEAHVRKSDGTEVVVLFNSDFEVTGVEEFDGRGSGGRGHGGRGGDETPLTGDTADKVTAAAKDEVPGGTILRVETDSGSAEYEAHVRKSDGTEVVVLFDKDLNVTGVEDMRSPDRTP